jgi:hypothetical protein
MAGLGCYATDWLACANKALALFGFVLGVPLVAVSALLGLLLDEIFSP